MKWTVSEARRRLSALFEAAATEPQAVFRRGRLVAAVVDGDTFAAFARWQQAEATRSIAAAFEELRQITAEEGQEIHWPERRNRTNAFLEALDELPQ